MKRARGRGSKGFGSGRVGGRMEPRTKRRKMAFFEGCPVGWAGSWPGGRGRPRGLIPGKEVREGNAYKMKQNCVC